MTQESPTSPGNMEAAKPDMFHAAVELIAREEPSCISKNTPSGKVHRKGKLKGQPEGAAVKGKT